MRKKYSCIETTIKMPKTPSHWIFDRGDDMGDPICVKHHSYDGCMAEGSGIKCEVPIITQKIIYKYA